jgi:hypothetical protein
MMSHKDREFVIPQLSWKIVVGSMNESQFIQLETCHHHLVMKQGLALDLLRSHIELQGSKRRALGRRTPG